MLDPQVQICMIELAQDWVSESGRLKDVKPENYIEKTSKAFDEAYKAILKTVHPEETSSTPKAVSYM